MTTITNAAYISLACAQGNHTRCLGVVSVHPPVNGRTTAPCACDLDVCAETHTRK